GGTIMTSTIATNACECCDQSIASTGHFDDSEYPVGSVLCRPCWRDYLLGRALGLDIECSRLSTPETVRVTPDGMFRTEVTAEGTTTEKVWNGGIVWCGDTEPP